MGSDSFPYILFSNVSFKIFSFSRTQHGGRGMDAKPAFNSSVMTLFLEFHSSCEEIPFILQRN